MKCFEEIINIGYAVYRVHGLPWFRSLSWYFLLTSNYFFYGENLIDYFGVVINRTVSVTLLTSLCPHDAKETIPHYLCLIQSKPLVACMKTFTGTFLIQIVYNLYIYTSMYYIIIRIKKHKSLPLYSSEFDF